jgi:ubiquinol-cytochrome c reductase cytochrome c1 subunit
MKKLIAVAALALLPLTSFAGGGAAVQLEDANIDLTNHAAIQRGAKYFTNYCMGCHSAKYVRYQLMKEVGLTEEEIKENLMFDKNKKVGDLMTIALAPEDAGKWFGAPAPDLTLEARLRKGPDWIYSYLKGFYSDPSRPMGVNNTVFKNVGMPNVLWELEGIKEAVYRYDVAHNGHAVESFDNKADAAAAAAKHGEGYKVEKHVESLKMVKPGKLSAAEFDQVARDLSTYLVYIAEPNKLERQQMGLWVILFLSIFTVIAYMTKKEWWKDVH